MSSQNQAKNSNPSSTASSEGIRLAPALHFLSARYKGTEQHVAIQLVLLGWNRSACYQQGMGELCDATGLGRSTIKRAIAAMIRRGDLKRCATIDGQSRRTGWGGAPLRYQWTDRFISAVGALRQTPTLTTASPVAAFSRTFAAHVDAAPITLREELLEAHAIARLGLNPPIATLTQVPNEDTWKSIEHTVLAIVASYPTVALAEILRTFMVAFVTLDREWLRAEGYPLAGILRDLHRVERRTRNALSRATAPASSSPPPPSERRSVTAPGALAEQVRELSAISRALRAPQEGRAA